MSAIVRVLPRSVIKPVVVSRHLARVAEQEGTGATTREAALQALCCQFLAGDLSAGQLWSLPGNAPIGIARELGLETNRLWNDEAVNSGLTGLARSTNDPMFLAHLCLNPHQAKAADPIYAVAAMNPNSPWQTVLLALVKLPLEACADSVLRAHEADRDKIMAGLFRQNYRLWNRLELSRFLSDSPDNSKIA